MEKFLYRPIYRPAHFAALPKGIKWDYVEAPKSEPMIAVRRGLPLSRHQFGVIEIDRQLTQDELKTYELEVHG